MTGARRPARALAATALVLGLAAAAPVPAAAPGDVLLREEFTDLDAWRPLTFPKIARHSVYAIEAGPPGSGLSWLRAASDCSASGLVWQERYDVREHPRLRWRWRVANVYEKGDVTKKSGDDYPIRLYVLFGYDPSLASPGKRLKYALAKAMHGEYPPDGGIAYVWDSRASPMEWVLSPYTDSVAMFLKEKGPVRVGQWIVEEADASADYRKAFGKDPPRAASLAVMNDADDTCEKSVSFVDWVEISRPAR